MRSLPSFSQFLLLLLLTVTACRKPPAPPVQLSPGAELYGRMCAVCHGDKGQGYKADQAPRLAQPDFQASVTDAALRDAIKNGRTGTTMSAWSKERGGPLTAQDVEAVIQFLRGFRTTAAVALDESPVTGDAARAEPVFARECSRCHGVRGVGGPNIQIGNPELLQTASNGFLRHAIKNGRPGTLMPSFSQTLGAAGIEDLTALLRTWASPPPPTPAPALPSPIPLGPVSVAMPRPCSSA